MIPFENTWPYEEIMGDLYFLHCPFCESDNVILPFDKEDLQHIRDGAKKLLVLPCCRGSVKIVDADDDYLLADRKIR